MFEKLLTKIKKHTFSADKNELNKKLLLAIADDQLSLVNHYLSKGASTETIDDEEGFSALAWATIFNRPFIIDCLLSYNADIDAKSRNGWTPLLFATRWNNADLVKLLIARGANPDLADNDGCTALIQATHDNFPDMVELLLMSKVDINYKDKDGRTALMWSLKKKHADLSKLFIECNAILTLADNDGHDALKYAEIYGHQEIFNMITGNYQDAYLENDKLESLIERHDEKMLSIVF